MLNLFLDFSPYLLQQDYEGFNAAVENEELEQFLKMK